MERREKNGEKGKKRWVCVCVYVCSRRRVGASSRCMCVCVCVHVYIYSFDRTCVCVYSYSQDYIAVKPKFATFTSHTGGRYQTKRFRKAQCPIVERLTNSLMMHGRNNGKKIMAVRILRHAMEIIYLLTDQNPIQVVVDAIINRCVYICGITTTTSSLSPPSPP